MVEGWIKLHRSLTSWEWYRDVPTKTVFIHLLLSVNHADAKCRGRQILRGQKWTSIGILSDETGLTIKQVRGAIEKLEMTGEVVSERASNGTMITVCKYDSYQEIPKPKGKQKGEPRANQGQATGQRKGNKQEEEEQLQEEEERKKEKALLPPHFEDAELNEVYLTYLKMRVEKKVKTTPTSIVAQIKKMSALEKPHAIWTLQHSIENGYTGLFPEKYNRQSPAPNGQQPPPSQKIVRPWHDPSWIKTPDK